MVRHFEGKRMKGAREYLAYKAAASTNSAASVFSAKRLFYSSLHHLRGGTISANKLWDSLPPSTRRRYQLRAAGLVTSKDDKIIEIGLGKSSNRLPPVPRILSYDPLDQEDNEIYPRNPNRNLHFLSSHIELPSGSGVDYADFFTHTGKCKRDRNVAGSSNDNTGKKKPLNHENNGDRGFDESVGDIVYFFDNNVAEAQLIENSTSLYPNCRQTPKFAAPIIDLRKYRLDLQSLLFRKSEDICDLKQKFISYVLRQFIAYQLSEQSVEIPYKDPYLRNLFQKGSNTYTIESFQRDREQRQRELSLMAQSYSKSLLLSSQISSSSSEFSAETLLENYEFIGKGQEMEEKVQTIKQIKNIRRLGKKGRALEAKRSEIRRIKHESAEYTVYYVNKKKMWTSRFFDPMRYPPHSIVPKIRKSHFLGYFESKDDAIAASLAMKDASEKKMRRKFPIEFENKPFEDYEQI